MSLRRHILNRVLRWTEKPYLARVTAPEELRDGFERRARFWFWPPRGTRFEQRRLGRPGVPVLWARAGARDGRGVLLYFHGGGYIFGSPSTHSAMLARLAQLTGAAACLPDYRLAPEHPFPAGVEDAYASYRALLASGVPAWQIILGGDSAGGGLVLALLGEILARGLPKPAGLFALSPLTDLTFSGASFAGNVRADVLLPAVRAEETADMYLQGADPCDPRASPLFADFTGAPEICLFVGDTEILLDDTRRLAARLRAQGVAVRERIVHDLPHVWPIFQRLLPEADATLAELAGWIRRRLETSDES